MKNLLMMFLVVFLFSASCAAQEALKESIVTLKKDIVALRDKKADLKEDIVDAKKRNADLEKEIEETVDEAIADAEILKALEEKEGFLLPKAAKAIIAKHLALYKSNEKEFNAMSIQAEVFKGRMIQAQNAAISESWIFLASVRTASFPDGVPRSDMKNWIIDGDRVRRTGE